MAVGREADHRPPGGGFVMSRHVAGAQVRRDGVRKAGGSSGRLWAFTYVVPFVYESVNIWRTVHPTTSVVPTLPGGMPRPFWLSVTTFMLLFIVLLNVRVNLARRQAMLDDLYLAEED